MPEDDNSKKPKGAASIQLTRLRKDHLFKFTSDRQETEKKSVFLKHQFDGLIPPCISSRSHILVTDISVSKLSSSAALNELRKNHAKYLESSMPIRT